MQKYETSPLPHPGGGRGVRQYFFVFFLSQHYDTVIYADPCCIACDYMVAHLQYVCIRLVTSQFPCLLVIHYY